MRAIMGINEARRGAVMMKKLTMSCFLGWWCFMSVGVARDLEGLPPYAGDATATRDQIPSVYRWNLSDLVASDTAFEQGISDAERRLEALRSLHDTMGDLEGLGRYLMAYFALDERVNRLTLYANLQRDVDTGNQEKIAHHERALTLTHGVMKEGPKIRKVVLGLPRDEVVKSMESGTLQPFAPYIQAILRRADHVLGPEGERVLALAGDNLWAQIDLNELPSPSEKAFRALMADLTYPTIADEQGREVQLNGANYGRFRASSDRRVRRDAVKAFFTTVKGVQNALAATLAGQAEFSVFLARARGYDTAIEAYLDKDQLTPDVYMNLIHTVHANLDKLHRYVRLRKKIMNVDDVHIYDLYVPLVDAAEANMDYEEGVSLILDALKPMGPKYIQEVARGMDPRNGWIDVYPYQGKDSGAFSSSVYGCHPYVKMNFQDRFDDVSTLAHEFGHAMHSHLSMTHQPYLQYRYAPFLAEIASTCNEALLSGFMIEKADNPKVKAWLLSELLESIRTTIYRQTLFAEFELKFHQAAETGQPINAQWLNSTYADLIHTYYGPDFTMDPHDDIEWAYIPHFYYKYYVFTYATGLSSGLSFAEKIRRGDEALRDGFLTMLKSGSAKPPLVLLKEAGLDLTKPEAIQAAFDRFGATLDQLETLLPELDD